MEILELKGRYETASRPESGTGLDAQKVRAWMKSYFGETTGPRTPASRSPN